MVRLIPKHNFIHRHKVIVQENVVDPLCRSYGEEEETSHHVVAESPAFVAIRRRSLPLWFTKVLSTGRCRLLSSFGKLISALCKIKEKGNAVYLGIVSPKVKAKGFGNEPAVFSVL